jgi:hypothetical protein
MLAGVRMSYRIFDVAPNGVARERRQQTRPVAVERRVDEVNNRPRAEVEWGRLRDRLRTSDVPEERTDPRRR